MMSEMRNALVKRVFHGFYNKERSSLLNEEGFNYSFHIKTLDSKEQLYRFLLLHSSNIEDIGNDTLFTFIDKSQFKINTTLLFEDFIFIQKIRDVMKIEGFLCVL